MLADETLDTRGLVCSIPILKARKALGALVAGQVLEVLASDPAAPKDFVAFCSATGHELADSGERDNTF